AMPGDGFTVAGFPVADVPFYVVATHSGITLAPLLGRLVADELHGHESPLLKDFRPGRFTSGAVLPPPPPARRPGEQ
ncbi:FAD-binding oxidoreductase, partial [Streptomyces albiflaviniger]|nr:FAD-binding oxidoreductase [Streptomyces albiflaviniger]